VLHATQRLFPISFSLFFRRGKREVKRNPRHALSAFFPPSVLGNAKHIRGIERRKVHQFWSRRAVPLLISTFFFPPFFFPPFFLLRAWMVNEEIADEAGSGGIRASFLFFYLLLSPFSFFFPLPPDLQQSRERRERREFGRTAGTATCLPILPLSPPPFFPFPPPRPNYWLDLRGNNHRVVVERDKKPRNGGECARRLLPSFLLSPPPSFSFPLFSFSRC